MPKITNTGVNEFYPEWCLGGNPGAIEAQESRGEEELLASAILPTNVHGREKLEAQGVMFGEPLPDDPLFCYARLPAGWKKRATDHSMWIEIVDNEGTVQAKIFYKAAFYDRSATLYAIGDA